MDNSCLICKGSFDDDVLLHKHLRSHKIKIKDYYLTYYPRTDLWSGEPLPFKDKEHYFSHDFLKKSNMANWVNSQETEVAKAYCKKLLQDRKERHKLVFSPCQVELSSILSPSVNYYEKLFGDYYKLCEELGFKNRFCYCKSIQVPNLSYKVKVDTREQIVLNFPRYEVTKLDFGDYCLESHDRKVYFERKSLRDFVGTLSGGFERFKREIERAALNDCYLIVIVEASLSKCLHFESFVAKQVKVGPEYVFHHVRSLIQDYSNLQFLFVENSQEAVRVMPKIFACTPSYKTIDLQSLYDKKGL